MWEDAMFAQVSTVAFQGIEARLVEAQVQIGAGLPHFTIVGLPDKAVAESRERVRAAMNSIGLGLPPKRITVNLAPADMPKEGSHFDLAIALGLMSASGAMSAERLAPYCVIGELGLNGSIAPVTGALPAAIGANSAGKGLICPEASGSEAAWASGDMPILAAPHILAIVNHFKGIGPLQRPSPHIADPEPASLDLRDVRGQESAKRALEVAAAGGHHLLMIGPPGAGKSMLAQRLPSILPSLEPMEMLEVSMIQSLAGALLGGRISATRPFRAPHHSASMAALVGGGSAPKPGEVSLAHHGVLFLDELPEFSPRALDALRQPLETGECTIARAYHRISYPAKIQLAAAMNPCRCGRAFEPGYSCKQGARCTERYMSRVSGPLWDRMDIVIEAEQTSFAGLTAPPAREGSAEARARVTAARARQRERYQNLGLKDVLINSHCPAPVLEEAARPDAEGRALLHRAAEGLGLSARGYHRALRVARTIADLDGEDVIRRTHVAEALSYRSEAFHSALADRTGS
jgi:magnesium chelatase family protein